MASKPATSEALRADGSGMGRAITARMQPRLTLGNGRFSRHARPGQLMRATVTFGQRVGLSTQNRRQYDDAVGNMLSTVRPPIDYWPWPDTGEQPTEPSRVPVSARSSTPAVAAPASSTRAKKITAAEVKAWSKADELKRMLTGRGLAALAEFQPTSVPAPATASSSLPAGLAEANLASTGADVRRTAARPAPVHRGLPLTPRRRGGTWAGPRTSPGGMAAGASPTPTSSVAPPRYTSYTAEPLPDVARTGVVDTPEPRASRFSGNSSRTPAVPPATLSADSLARRVLDPVPVQQSSSPKHPTPPGPRPGGSLGRAVADGIASRRAPSSVVQSDAQPRRRAPAGEARPSITAEMLRPTRSQASDRVPEPAPTVFRRSSDVSGGEPTTHPTAAMERSRTEATLRRSPSDTPTTTRVGTEFGAGSTLVTPPLGGHEHPGAANASPPAPMSGLPTAVSRVTAASEQLTSVGPLPTAGHALANRSASAASVALMDRVAAAPEALIGDQPTVIPPRVFTGWTNEDVASEPIATRTATIVPLPLPLPLPLATVARRRRHLGTDGMAQRHPDAAAGEPDRLASSSTKVAPHLLARSLAVPPRRSVAVAHVLSPLPDGSLANGTTVVAPVHGHVYLGRRVMSRSADGRHVRWNAPVAQPDTDPLALTGPDTSLPRPHLESRRDAGAPGPVDEAGAVAPRPSRGPAPQRRTDGDAVVDIPGPLARDLPLAELRNDHILRRTLYAANEIAATLGDLAVAPPPAGGFSNAETQAATAMQALGADRPATSARPSVAALAPVAPGRVDSGAVAPGRVASGRVAALAPVAPGRVAPGRVAPGAVAKHWVPALPGTLFSSLAGGGSPVRRALLTLPEMLRTTTATTATTDDATDAMAVQRARLRPGQPGVVHGALNLGPAQAVASRPANDRVSADLGLAQVASAERPEPAPMTRTQDPKVRSTAAPLVDPDVMAVAPRSVQRVGTADVVPADAGAVLGQRAGVRRPAGTVDAPASPAALADRFLTELARHRQDRPKPLPTQFASIADLIVGKRRPLVSTSEASQRALAAVDKVAATTGDVIHLAAPTALTRPTAEMTGIIAHELTHVAAPSPAPRFFADDRHTAEERRATEIGEIMRRSPAPPPSGSIASRGGTTPMTITEQHTRSASTGNVTSTTSTTSTTGKGTGGRADTIRRVMDSAPAPSVQRAVTDTQSAQSMTSSSDSYDSGGSGTSITSAQFSRLLREHFDLIVELLEDRIGSDIERRGGRYRGSY